MCDISYSNKQSAHVETDRTAYYILNWLQIYPTQAKIQAMIKKAILGKIQTYVMMEF